MTSTPAPTPTTTTSPWASRTFVSAGCELHFLRAGGGKPLLLLHGVTDNAAYWGATGRHLAGRFDVIALDQRGHGLSAAPPWGYRMTDYVADAALLLRTVAQQPAIVMGHSLGGWVANRLAADHPELVSALVLEDAPFRDFGPVRPTVEEEDQQRLAWFGWLRDLQGLGAPELIAQCHAANPAWSEEDCLLWAVSKRQVRPRLWSPDGIEFDLNWKEAAARVRCPVLFIHGDAERGSIIDAAQARVITELMADCRPAYIAGAGHAIHRDQPAAMQAAVDAFLDA